jgi:predicted RNA-binding protein (virulence factor B family)
MNIGRFHELPVWVVGKTGVLLGDRHDHVILPAHEDPGGLEKGQRLRVFVTTDTHDQPTATLHEPAGEVGDLRMMTVVDATEHGVFVHWGLPKDLFVPWRHQHERLEVGDQALVYIALDDRDRPVGWTKLVDILVADTREAQVGKQVELVVYAFNDHGVLCAVDGRWSGLLYADKLHGRYRVGDRMTGFVERIRDNGKLDLSLVPVGRAGTRHAVDIVREALAEEGGFLPLTDRSSPDLIRQRLGVSKKAFKKAVGALYKQREVVIEDGGVRSVE